MAEPCPRSWVQSVLNDDVPAEAELWVKLMEWGEATARYKGLSADIGRDAAIQAYHRVQRMKERFEEQGTDTDSSFCRMCRFIVSREVLRIIGSQGRVQEQGFDERLEAILPGKRDPEPRLSAAELFARIKPCLDELTDIRRQAIEFRYFHHLPPKDIAVEMDRSPGAIYTAMHHALTQLQRCLRQLGYGSIGDVLSP